MGIINPNPLAGGTAGGSLEGTYPNPTIAPSAITSAMILAETIAETRLNAFLKRRLLGETAPEAAVEHTSATYEITPSATKASIVYIRAISKGAATAEYNVKVGGVLVTQILDPSIATSIDITIPVYVPINAKVVVEKVAGELEKSFTSIQLMN